MNEIGEFVPPTRQREDELSAQHALNHPIAVKIHEVRDRVVTEHSPEGKPALMLDVWDLATNQVYCGVMWMNAAIVDKLGGLSGDGKIYPIKVIEQTPRTGGKAYYTPIPLDGEEKNTALQWLGSEVGQGIFERVRAERGYGTYQVSGVGTFGGRQQAAAPQMQAPPQQQMQQPPAMQAPPQQQMQAPPQWGAPPQSGGFGGQQPPAQQQMQQPPAMQPPVQQMQQPPVQQQMQAPPQQQMQPPVQQMQQPPAMQAPPAPPAMPTPGTPAPGAMAAGNGYDAPAFGAPNTAPPMQQAPQFAQPGFAQPGPTDEPPF